MFDLFSDEPTSAVLHPIPKARRDAIKAEGGQAYADLLKREREQIRARRLANGRQDYDRKKRVPFKTNLCARARKRGRARGLEATITPADLIWPTHCPVLGLELEYPERTGERKGQTMQPNWPSLDRWDNAKGYVPGNVFVISLRANSLKNSATYDEILRVAKYLSKKP